MLILDSFRAYFNTSSSTEARLFSSASLESPRRTSKNSSPYTSVPPVLSKDKVSSGRRLRSVPHDASCFKLLKCCSVAALPATTILRVVAITHEYGLAAYIWVMQAFAQLYSTCQNPCQHTYLLRVLPLFDCSAFVALLELLTLPFASVFFSLLWMSRLYHWRGYLW
eukprot:m.607990 g.607990  ORF g.607990 m.607990 type:complete len:167 (+) comp22483_c0_seq2:3630-4130(+)